MSQLEPSKPEKFTPKSLQFVTHYYSKRDVMRLWGVTDYDQFQEMLGDDGKQLLNWRDGRQRFTPAKVRELVQYLGEPLTISIQ